MASIFRGQSRSVIIPFAFLITQLFPTSAIGTGEQLFEEPVLVIDAGMHTNALSSSAGVDAAGRLAATGSDDKTLRIWSLADGQLRRTIFVPNGSGSNGQLFAVAMSPNGTLVATGGYTGDGFGFNVYLFETDTGTMIAHHTLPSTIHSLGFSRDGRYLATGFGLNNGIRIYDRDIEWKELLRDGNYGGGVVGLSFSQDGRLATVSRDGYIRLYNGNFQRIGQPFDTKALYEPRSIAFSPDGTRLAVGFLGRPNVMFFDALARTRLPGPDVQRLNPDGANLWQVAFSADGETFYAGGRYYDDHGSPVFAWDRGGLGDIRILPVGSDSVAHITPLPDGAVLIGSNDPSLTVFERDGHTRWIRRPAKPDFLGEYADRVVAHRSLAVSADGTVVDFGHDKAGMPKLRFDLRGLKLIRASSTDSVTSPPRQDGLPVEGWHDQRPTLNGKFLRINGQARSLAIFPRGDGFVLGSDFALTAYNEKGDSLWSHPSPALAWAVNVTRDGRLVVSEYGDGSIRWNRSDDGRELLALYVLPDETNWVAWTPEGFYGATPGAFGVLRWLVNRGYGAAAETVPVSAIPTLRRPEAIPLVLQEMETARALGIAVLRAARRDVQIATNSAKPPGAHLHVLTIGVSDYGPNAGGLKLNFAERDAADVASALNNTQEGGLYAEVHTQVLRNDTASRRGIFEALAALDRNMAAGSDRGDLAVIMFSGHGAMLDGQFYLVPYGVENTGLAGIVSSAISAAEFQKFITRVAAHGRVLVLLDACRSAGLIGTAVPGADVLKSVLSSSNVTVLTSSTADKLSREDEKWQHGAFTKVILDALSRSDDIDTDHNGVISMTELTAYVARHLELLTDGDQHLGLDQRFQGDIFVAGL